MLTPTLETKRLILRRFKESDIDVQYEIIHDKRLAKYLNFPDLTKEEELDCIKKWIDDADTDRNERWVIELKDGNIPIGNISVNKVNKKNNYCDIGYVITYDNWGNGYASEALECVTDYLLNTQRYYLVQGLCNELNVQSSRTMLKAGFKKDGCIPNRRMNKDGSYSGLEFYSKSK